MNINEKIKLVMVKRNKNGKDIAKALDCSTQNVYAKLQKNNWTVEQLEKIATELDCELEINFKLSGTEERF